MAYFLICQKNNCTLSMYLLVGYYIPIPHQLNMMLTIFYMHDAFIPNFMFLLLPNVSYNFLGDLLVDILRTCRY